MPIIPQLIKLPKGLVPLFPELRCCALCHGFGVHRHGTYSRYLPEAHMETTSVFVLVPRFLCQHCSRTFSILPPFLVRRIGMPLPMLLFLGATSRKWDDLLDMLQIARNTLWTWKRLGQGMLKILTELFSLPGLTWHVLSLHLSRWQYPENLSRGRPTIP